MSVTTLSQKQYYIRQTTKLNGALLLPVRLTALLREIGVVPSIF